jgi:hypothetical protein
MFGDAAPSSQIAGIIERCSSGGGLGWDSAQLFRDSTQFPQGVALSLLDNIAKYTGQPERL